MQWSKFLSKSVQSGRLSYLEGKYLIFTISGQVNILMQSLLIFFGVSSLGLGSGVYRL